MDTKYVPETVFSRDKYRCVVDGGGLWEWCWKCWKWKSCCETTFANGDLRISVESGRQILKFTPDGIVNKGKCEMYF